jgi:ribosomal protein L31
LESGGPKFEASQAESSQDSISTNKKLDMVVHACHPSYTGGVNRRTDVQANSVRNAKSYLKTKAKKGLSV